MKQGKHISKLSVFDAQIKKFLIVFACLTCLALVGTGLKAAFAGNGTVGAKTDVHTLRPATDGSDESIDVPASTVTNPANNAITVKPANNATVTITFDPNGGTFASGVEPVITVEEGADFVPYVDNDVQKQGYTLLGWKTADDTFFYPGQTYKASQTMTISAVWTQNKMAMAMPAGACAFNHKIFIDGQQQQDLYLPQMMSNIVLPEGDTATYKFKAADANQPGQLDFFYTQHLFNLTTQKLEKHQRQDSLYGINDVAQITGGQMGGKDLGSEGVLEFADQEGQQVCMVQLGFLRLVENATQLFGMVNSTKGTQIGGAQVNAYAEDNTLLATTQTTNSGSFMLLVPKVSNEASKAKLLTATADGYSITAADLSNAATQDMASIDGLLVSRDRSAVLDVEQPGLIDNSQIDLVTEVDGAMLSSFTLSKNQNIFMLDGATYTVSNADKSISFEYTQTDGFGVDHKIAQKLVIANLKDGANFDSFVMDGQPVADGTYDVPAGRVKLSAIFNYDVVVKTANIAAGQISDGSDEQAEFKVEKLAYGTQIDVDNEAGTITVDGKTFTAVAQKNANFEGWEKPTSSNDTVSGPATYIAKFKVNEVPPFVPANREAASTPQTSDASTNLILAFMLVAVVLVSYVYVRCCN